MKLTVTGSKNSKCFYVPRSVRKDGKITSVTVEKLGNYEQVKAKANGEDPYVWAKRYVEELNRKEYDEKKEIIVRYRPDRLLEKDCRMAYNAGYLFLQDIYYSLGLDKICKSISERHAFEYDLNDILSKLIYTRILYPASKASSFELSKKFLEQPNFQLQDVYRALSVLAEENDFIQAELYKNSQKVLKRQKDILYYDCTNYYFEIEMEDEYRKYGRSKENKPLPVVGMGLFMDQDGIPIAFNTFPGSVEEGTLIPLEKKIIRDFGVENVVVCTDAGLSSARNRRYNNLELDGVQVRSFITVQPLKKLKRVLLDWCLEEKGCQLPGHNRFYTLDEINEMDNKDLVFYKEKVVKEDLSKKDEKSGLKPIEQRLIVTYSVKYRDYLRHIRENQIRRAKKMIQRGDDRIGNHQNNPRRFIAQTAYTEDGEVCDQEVMYLNNKLISYEEQFDGFYAVCTNLENVPVRNIIRINKKRWEIEECFRIMKTTFEARPVYLHLEDHIKAHFLICFMALFVYRILEHGLDEQYTCAQLISTLQDMLLLRIESSSGYTPAFTRTDLTDALHEKFGFRLDHEFIPNRSLRSIISKSKK